MCVCNNFINDILDGEYSYVVVTEGEWNSIRDEYIKNIKNGIKYEIKELKKNIEKKTKKNTVVDKLFDLVGEDIVEFK